MVNEVTTLIAVAMACFGFVFGYWFRAEIAHAFDKGVKAGYRQCDIENQRFDVGWNAGRNDTLAAINGEVQITDCGGDAAERSKEDWERGDH